MSRFKRFIAISLVGILCAGAGFYLGSADGQWVRSVALQAADSVFGQAFAADQATRIARARQAVHQLRGALIDAEVEFAAIVDEGGLTWLNAADPPLPGDTASEAIAARQAIVAVRATLDDNSKTHEKSLVRFEN